MTKHIHAESILQYAQDALTTDKPWEMWEFRGATDAEWYGATYPGPSWYPVCSYRRKPMQTKTRVINGFTVPAPRVEVPGRGKGYFLAYAGAEDWCLSFRWSGVPSDALYLKRGMIFDTREAAVANAKAMCGVDPQWRQACASTTN